MGLVSEMQLATAFQAIAKYVGLPAFGASENEPRLSSYVSRSLYELRSGESVKIAH